MWLCIRHWNYNHERDSFTFTELILGGIFTYIITQYYSLWNLSMASCCWFKKFFVIQTKYVSGFISQNSLCSTEGKWPASTKQHMTRVTSFSCSGCSIKPSPVPQPFGVPLYRLDRIPKAWITEWGQQDFSLRYVFFNRKDAIKSIQSICRFY